MKRVTFAAVLLGYLVLVLLLGGASAAGFPGNLLLQLGGAVLIGWCLAVPDPVGTLPPIGLRAVLAGILGLAAIQLLPLPPAVWTLLPGREVVAHGYALLGQPLPWMPISLKPWATIASLAWWIPALAVLVGMVRSTGPSAVDFARTVLTVAVVSVALGAMQSAGGQPYFYKFTNYGLGTGFFANSNHQANFLLSALALWGAVHVVIRKGRTRAATSPVTRATSYAVAALLVIGVLLSNSVAGIGLLVALLAGVALLLRDDWRPSRAVALGGIAAVLLVMVLFVLYGALGYDATGAPTGSPTRLDYLAVGSKIVGEMFPFGSGLGSFRDIYHWYEPRATIGNSYVNHAHNDLLELMIETGAFGLIVLALFVRWWGLQALALWRARRSDPFPLAATLMTGAMMAHSLVDYPLRTAAMSSLFAAGCALMVRSRQAAHKRGARREEVGQASLIAI